MTKEEFRAWRIAHGLTQAQIAARLGVSYRTVQDWESGARPGVKLPMVELALEALAAREAQSVQGHRKTKRAPP